MQYCHGKPNTIGNSANTEGVDADLPLLQGKTYTCTSPCTFHCLAEASVSQNQEETGKFPKGLT